MTTITICVGSSCHLKGARELVKCFENLLKEHHLEDKVELKGSFCMELCGKGVNWQIDNEAFTSETVKDALKLFDEKVIRPLTGAE
ncbi:(2Fe-2S) ferredoxin domain-containing protein [candidate division KSB1 bacterium]|nr:(2Fe-2S) ferredoxin domain-containing protein [candidate division KSB1 bacterium]